MVFYAVLLFFKVSYRQEKHVREYPREKLIFYLSNNVFKTWSYELKISRNIEIYDLFYFKAYFNKFDQFHTSCPSTL